MTTETTDSHVERDDATLPTPPAAIVDPNEANEISLLDVLIVLAERKRTIFGLRWASRSSQLPFP